MQFHHHGYVTGDPRVLPASGVGVDRAEELPDEVDVLIVGSGPAGIIAAAQLAMFPEINTRIIERRDGRLELGQADGIQVRTVESFQAFGFAPQIIQEAYIITETAFWNPDPENPGNIIRTSITADDDQGISEFPHLVVNQARVIDYFAQFAANAPARSEVDYDYNFESLTVHGEGDYPVEVTLRRGGGFQGAGISATQQVGAGPGETRVVRAKYVVGADGARSNVRRSIGGSLKGDQSFHAWGVMDVLAKTDFPDARKKCVIHSAAGSILQIPREGNHLSRIYVDLGEVDENDGGKVRETPLETVIERANAILHPYTLDVRNVAWSSVYEVAHRLTDRFDDAATSPDGKARVFLLGDACHTHSAKAGQGMNVSMQDGWNLAWKLGYVLSGKASDALLGTYSDERQVTAKNLIDFDLEWSSLMAKKPEDLDSPDEVADFYYRTAEFPAGMLTAYEPSIVVSSVAQQHLATGFTLGKRFKSVNTVRVSDAVPVHIGHHHRADGRFRVYVFADKDCVALNEWAEWARTNANSPINVFTANGEDIDTVLDVKAIYQQAHHEVAIEKVPQVFLPASGPFGMTDYEKVYAAMPGDDIFSQRGISREGAIIVVRPDQYVSHILPLSARDELTDYFSQFLLPRS